MRRSDHTWTLVAAMVEATNLDMLFGVRRVILDDNQFSCYRGRESQGGLDADPGTTSSDAYGSWPPPPASGPGDRQVVCGRQCLLPGVRQGPGQVRDAARSPAGRCGCRGCRQSTW